MGSPSTEGDDRRTGLALSETTRDKGDDMVQQTVATRITEIATILVPVSDQERALDFYTGTLGFEKRMDYTYSGSRWIEVGPGGATTTLALARGGDSQVPGIDTGIRLSTDDARADHAALKAAGS